MKPTRWWVLIAAMALAGCSAGDPAARPPVDLPFAVGNGSGSQYGNSAARTSGETRGPAGERCILFTWDRPVTVEWAVRLTSESCESPQHPGRMICREVSRELVPITGP